MLKTIFILSIVFCQNIDFKEASVENISLTELIASTFQIEKLRNVGYNNSAMSENYIYILRNPTIEYWLIKSENNNVEINNTNNLVVFEIDKKRKGIIAPVDYIWIASSDYFIAFTKIERIGNEIIVELVSNTTEKNKNEKRSYFSATLLFRIDKELILINSEVTLLAE
jgi:hypothetical protein